MREGDWCLQSCWQQPKLGQNKRRKSCSYLRNVSGTNYDVSAAPTSTNESHLASLPSEDLSVAHARCHGNVKVNRTLWDLSSSNYTPFEAPEQEKNCVKIIFLSFLPQKLFKKKHFQKIWSFWHWFDLGPDWYLIGHMLYDVHRATCLFFCF